MPADDEAGDDLGLVGAPFELDGLAAGFFQDAAGVFDRLVRAQVVSWETACRRSTSARVHGPADHLGVVDHFVERDRQRVGMPLHDHRHAVADQDRLDAGLVEQPGHRVVVGREHRDFLARPFEGHELRDGQRGGGVGHGRTAIGLGVFATTANGIVRGRPCGGNPRDGGGSKMVATPRSERYAKRGSPSRLRNASIDVGRTRTSSSPSPHARSRVRRHYSESRPCCVVSSLLSLRVCVGRRLVERRLRAQRKAAAPKGTPIKIDGTVTQIVPQGIVVNGKDGKKYGVGFTPTSKVGLVGTAGVDFLKPGTFVQFDVDLDDERQAGRAKSKKIQITSHSRDQRRRASFRPRAPTRKPGEPGPYFVRGTVNDEQGRHADRLGRQQAR